MATVPVLPLGQQQATSGAVNGGVAAAGSVPSPSTSVKPILEQQQNVYAPSGAGTGTLSAVPGGTATPGLTPLTTPTSGVQQNGINWADGSNTVTGDFSDTYGKGTGTAITSVLQNLGTSTDSAVQALVANTNLAAGQQYGNIQATEAAGGVTPNSSTAALAAGDFYSNVNSQLQQTVSGMELGEENTLLGALTNEGSSHGSDSSFLGTLGDVLSGNESAISGLAGDSANALNETSASGTGGLSSILSMVGELA